MYVKLHYRLNILAHYRCCIMLSRVSLSS